MTWYDKSPNGREKYYKWWHKVLKHARKVNESWHRERCSEIRRKVHRGKDKDEFWRKIETSIKRYREVYGTSEREV